MLAALLTLGVVFAFCYGGGILIVGLGLCVILIITFFIEPSDTGFMWALIGASGIALFFYLLKPEPYIMTKSEKIEAAIIEGKYAYLNKRCPFSIHRPPTEIPLTEYFKIGYFILGLLVAIISLGAALPWVLQVYYQRDTLHTYYKVVAGNFGLEFTSKGGSELFFKGGYGLWWLLGMICTYFYSPTQSTILLVLAIFLLPSLAIISVYSWKTKNTHVTKRSFIE